MVAVHCPVHHSGNNLASSLTRGGGRVERAQMRQYVMPKATGDHVGHSEAKVAGSPPLLRWSVASTQSLPIVAERLYVRHH